MIYNDDIANKALKNGDEKAFTYIYNKYFPQLCFYAEKIIRSMETAKDIVQDLFTKLWENREKTDITTSLKAYLYGSVYNTCLTHLTHIKIVRNHIEYDLTLENCDNRQQTTDSNNPLSILILKEIENKIEKGIESLPARCKDVFLLDKNSSLFGKDIVLDI